MAMGTLYHAMAAAVDNGGDPAVAIAQVVHDYRVHPTYLVEDSPLLEQLANECNNKVQGGYNRMMTKGQYSVTEIGETIFDPTGTFVDNDGATAAARFKLAFSSPRAWRTLAVEEEFKMPLPLGAHDGFVLKCIPDKVIRDGEGHLWVVERKTTERDDRKWVGKWRLNAQTTAEALCVAHHYSEPVQGVLLEQVVITRQRSTKHIEHYVGEPQPINKVMFHPHRPVPKSRFILEEGKAYYRGIAKEILWRRRTNRQWDPNYNNCGVCDYNDICDGTMPAEQALIKVPRHR